MCIFNYTTCTCRHWIVCCRPLFAFHSPLHLYPHIILPYLTVFFEISSPIGILLLLPFYFIPHSSFHLFPELLHCCCNRWGPGFSLCWHQRVPALGFAQPPQEPAPLWGGEAQQHAEGSGGLPQQPLQGTGSPNPPIVIYGCCHTQLGKLPRWGTRYWCCFGLCSECPVGFQSHTE